MLKGLSSAQKTFSSVKDVLAEGSKESSWKLETSLLSKQRIMLNREDLVVWCPIIRRTVPDRDNGDIWMQKKTRCNWPNSNFKFVPQMCDRCCEIWDKSVGILGRNLTPFESGEASLQVSRSRGHFISRGWCAPRMVGVERLGWPSSDRRTSTSVPKWSTVTFKVKM